MDEEDDSLPTSCSFLQDPLSLNELLGTGAKFTINSNFDEGFTNEIFEELNLGSDDEDESVALNEGLVSPWTRPFEELKAEMVKVNEHIYKKVTRHGNLEEGTVPVNSRVSINYNAYWEGEGVPFDSSTLRSLRFTFYTDRNTVIEGLEAAVRTMYRGERAQFLISYKLLFLEMGCPPRVKPRADGLFIIELIDFTVIGNLKADLQIPEEDRTKYRVVVEKVKDIHLRGLDLFAQSSYKNACRAFERAVGVLNFCRLADEEEQREQTAFLLKLYTNLAVCYNKMGLPSKTCIMCKQIRRLTGNKPSCKALFQEGRAMFMLSEYERARVLLIQAQQMEPQNNDINKELTMLSDRYTRYKENEKRIWTKAMGMKKDTEKQRKFADTSSATNYEFEAEMQEVMESFKNNLSINKFTLPQGLSDPELVTINKLARKLNLKLSISPLQENSYILGRFIDKTSK